MVAVGATWAGALAARAAESSNVADHAGFGYDLLNGSTGFTRKIRSENLHSLRIVAYVEDARPQYPVLVSARTSPHHRTARQKGC
jgi:hypothetical protein